ncbi:hypothetical protein K32_48910 [Kaistia sp. 32K]|uniref:DNA cytosine methyltransferase n=1 Tax=Kaistia sp. 32K TaxID=2795690 RepID=UPI001915BDA7|nr:DNA cytosine methyltransferase [Kaistia sp. 32K]BCP56274.1 hypothetical protein K32_48910 [Kaistia sp. 32K]
MLTYGSVCSGIEAASVAWHPLGWRPEWFAEIEKFPSAVLAHQWPDIPNMGDMTKIAAMVRAEAVAAPDVLVGGTPCQAFSVAGARAGLADPRGQLTLAYVDLANAIDSTRALRGKQPAVIVWENVPGVLSSKDNAFGCFLAGLAGEDCELQPPGGRWSDAGCVFGPQRTIAWRVCDAQYFGVAQRRRRVFVVASARDGFDPTAVLFEREGVRRDTPPSRSAGQDVTAGTLRSTDGGSDVDHARANHLVTGTLMANGKAAGSATQQDAEQGMLVVHGTQDPCTSTHTAFTLGRNNGAENVLAFSCKDYGADAGPLSPTLRAMGHGESHANAGGQVAVVIGCDGTVDGPVPPLMARSSRGGAQTLSPGHQTDGHMIATCVTGDITHTLKAEGFDASEDGTGRGQPIIAAFAENSRAELRYEAGDGSITGALKTGGGKAGQSYPVAQVGMAVRRLTPRECERLQAFPDDYTLIPYGRPVRMEKLEQDWIKYLLRGGVMTLDQACQAAADGPRYKALGNSMCVYNMRWIGRRISSYLTVGSGTLS